jgi:hypothetical protein
MCWMIVLVSLNLWMVCDRRLAADRPLPAWAPTALGFACTAFLAVVLAVTRGGYVRASGSSFAEHLRDSVDPAVIAGVRDGEHVCLRREPHTFLYAAPFHDRRYVVREVEAPKQCGDARWVP